MMATSESSGPAKKSSSIVGRIVLGLVVVLAVLAGVVAMQPDELNVTRSAVLQASPEQVFDHVNNLHLWDAWSPWDKRDPDMKKTFEGPDAGVGAAYRWVGNSEVGEGKLSITESKPAESIQMKLEFIKPFEDTNDVSFTFAPKDGGTEVVWAMHGKNNFISKAMGLVMDMDKMIGGDFEEGLNNLKSIVKKQPAE